MLTKSNNQHILVASCAPPGQGGPGVSFFRLCFRSAATDHIRVRAKALLSGEKPLLRSSPFAVSSGACPEKSDASAKS